MAIPCNGQLTMLQGLTMSVPQQLLLHIAAVDTTETAESDSTPQLDNLLLPYVNTAREGGAERPPTVLL